MANTATNVTAGKPRVGGAIYVETASTSSLPTSADAELTGFTSLGYVSEDGLTNANTYDSNDIKDWGGATVLTIEDNFSDTFTFTLIEALNTDVLKQIFGDANVTGTLATGVTVKAVPTARPSKKWVVDMVMRNGVLKRICIPVGTISAIGEIAYKNDGAVGYQVTLTCVADTSGNTHYEYMKTPSTTSGGGEG